MTPAELLRAMSALLDTGPWDGLEPAPVFVADGPRDSATQPAAYGTLPGGEVAAIAASVRSGERSAVAVAEAALAAAAASAARLNAFTSLRVDAVLADARSVDATVAAGGDPGLLAGVPVAVKDLLDVSGTVTLAGSRSRVGDAPAAADATAVARLRAAGALVVGSTNMDELAYGFTTENSHFGTTRNPHDAERVAGGSSGGSACAVAAGIVAAAIGSDTNGSIRIPAAFCGVYGLRPTYGRIPNTGAVPFASSFDALGPIARHPADAAALLAALAGPDGVDRAAALAPALERPAVARFLRAGGELWDGAQPEPTAAAAAVADALGAVESLELPDVGRARAAAIVITAAEGAAQHRELLRSSPGLVDPRVRERFLAGLDVGAGDYLAAQRFRSWWQREVLLRLGARDILVLPTTPCAAPLDGTQTVEIGGITLPVGAVLGRFTQPLSFIGLPALSIPVASSGALPAGVQLVGRPGAELTLLAAAAELERRGVAGYVPPRPARAVA